MSAITTQANPAQVLLRVESIEAAMPLSTHPCRPKEALEQALPHTLYDQTLSSFFAIQWPLSELEAIKHLAKATTTTTYEFQSAGSPSTPSPMRSYLERTAKNLHHTGKARNVMNPYERRLLYKTALMYSRLL